MTVTLYVTTEGSREKFGARVAMTRHSRDVHAEARSSHTLRGYERTHSVPRKAFQRRIYHRRVRDLRGSLITRSAISSTLGPYHCFDERLETPRNYTNYTRDNVTIKRVFNTPRCTPLALAFLFDARFDNRDSSLTNERCRKSARSRSIPHERRRRDTAEGHRRNEGVIALLSSRAVFIGYHLCVYTSLRKIRHSFSGKHTNVRASVTCRRC